MGSLCVGMVANVSQELFHKIVFHKGDRQMTLTDKLNDTLNELLVRLFKDILEIEGKSLITENSRISQPTICTSLRQSGWKNPRI